MNFPIEEDCLKAIKDSFGFLVDGYGYVLNHEQASKFNVEVSFENARINRKIRTANHTDYTDYGFEVFIFNTATGDDERDYAILANIPFEKQDKGCAFVARVAKYIQENLSPLISGQEWKQESRILYQE